MMSSAWRMPQLSLFESRETVFADDERGQIVYTPRFVDPDLARRWFEEVRDGVQWKAERRMMYDREVDVPRLVGHFHLRTAHEESIAPAALRDAAARVREATGEPFNSVGLNFYRDGRDSVAPHNDHLDVLVKGHPIALVSLGSARRMTVRAKAAPPRVLHIDLEPGSLFVMSYDTQLHYTHGIPKTKEVVGPRISLAFRVKPVPADDEEDVGDPYR
jgi:alkylated DNA repair dioxygenase AlkB